MDVVFDKWDLKEGQDKFHFMEQMVRDPAIQRVLMICDKQYADKADGRKGGVGTESQIISKEIYEDVTQKKFIPIVVQLDESGKPHLPTFVTNRIYIDLSDHTKFEVEYEQLLRNIYDRPLHRKPKRGVPPAYITDESESISYRSISIQNQLRNTLINDKQSANGLLDDLFDSILTHLHDQRGRHIDKPVDERVLASIEDLIPVRNCIINAVLDLCKYRDQFPAERFKEFLEKLLQFNFRPEHVTSWHEHDFDDYRFFNYEVLLYTLAILIKQRRYCEASQLIYAQYFYYDDQHWDGNITTFNCYLRSLEKIHKQKINSNLITIFGEKIKERAQHKVIEFADLMFAESLLYFTMSLQGQLYEWYPRTLVYRRRSETFDFYVRLKSKSHFERVKSLFGVQTREEYKSLVEKAIARHAQENRSGGWNEHNFPSIASLANLDLICSVP